MMGMGILPSNDRQNLGMIGVCGDENANNALVNADTLLFIGARAGERAIPTPGIFTGKEIIHIDIDPAELGKNIIPTVPVVCDCRCFLEKLSELLSGTTFETWTKRFFAESLSPAGDYIKKLTEKIKGKITIAADVGNNQITAAMSSFLDGGRFITSGGMGTMGYALPAAIGAKTADPDMTVICICGDGGFQMSLAELATVREQNLAIKIIILNDSSLGMVRDFIAKDPWDAAAFGTDLSAGNPDFTAVAGCFGIASERVTDFSDKSIDRIINAEGAYLVDLII
jgi:acetolactate synthase-1/2/3 large subunit